MARFQKAGRLALSVVLTLALTLGSFPSSMALAIDEEATPPAEEPTEFVEDVPAGDEQADVAPVVPDVEVIPDEEPAPASSEDSAPVPEAAEPEAPRGVVLTYEDDKLVATVEAAAGVLPEGATLSVSEVRPVDAESADAYGEALAALSEALREEDRSYSSATVYDIQVLDADGVEIEPSGDVRVNVSYKKALPLGDVELVSADDDTDELVPVADVAHFTNEGELQMMGAELVTNDEGDLEEATFTTDSFSYYITFGTNQGDTEEPIDIGPYGWLKFATPTEKPYPEDSNGQWGHYSATETLPTIYPGTERPDSVSPAAWEEQYHRILQVRLHVLNPGGNETSYDDANYSNVANNEYFWTWENSIYISDFYVPGYEVVQTKMHTAWDTGDPVQQDSLVGSYSVRGYRSSDGTANNELGVDRNLNVLDVYMKPVPTPQNAMRYIVRYVHADGSVTDGNVRYLPPGQSITINVDQPRSGERFSGIAVAAGAEAVTSNTSAKTVAFTYDENVNLAKAYVYFEDDPENNTTQTRGRYDRENGNYYNGATGLYTDKSAEAVPGVGHEREFLVNLEAWYVDNAASVGMILDASGSMVWTAGAPTELDLDSILNELPSWQRNSILSHNNQWNTIPLNDLTNWGILDTSEVDNSNLGYNSYKYYVYTTTAASTNPVNEYAPLGYARGATNNTLNRNPFRLGVGNTTEGYADRQNDGGQAGWYYVNPSTTADSVNQYGSKRFEGVTNNGQGGTGPATFWVRTNSDGSHTLMCRFDCGSTDQSAGPRTQTSPVYVKRDQMMTKAETLQDSIAQFAAILNGVSPASEVAISRFSHNNFTNLNLLDWTTDSEAIIAAMDLVKGSPYVNGNSTKGDRTYQYVITGGTLSRFGFENFSSVHKAHADSGNNQKYIILFTDGKDQGPSRGYPMSREWLQQNGYGDYTIITMFMRSKGMSEQDIADSRTFLQGLASGGKDGNPNEKLFFEASSEDPHAVVEQFRQIAEHIVTGLSNYSVRDYIDPRFDVVNEAGQVLTVLDENGEFTHDTNPDVDPVTRMRGFTTPDGKQAQLGYDPQRKMFYVIWQHQDIQASPVGGESVTPWKGQIRVVAKEDFLGGNDILTNGNEPNENLVYKPQTDNSGNTQYDQYGRELVDTSQEHKSFPFAAVNPGLLDVALGNYEDTIFLGEEITPGDLLSTLAATTPTSPAKERADAQHRVMDTVYDAALMEELGDTDQSSIWYVEYLERLGVKRHNDINFYYTLLRHVKLTGTGGVEPIITALKSDSNYTVTEASGSVTVVGRDGTPAAGEKITIIKTGDGVAKIELELPYYYLDSPTDPTQTAGRDRTNVMDPQDDQVGTITYTWKLVDFAANQPNKDSKDEANDFVTFDTYVNQSTHMDTTEPVQYQFSMSYQPLLLTSDARSDGSSRPSEGDGSERTRALTGLTNPNAALIRNVDASNERIGPEATTDEMGWAVIHAVDGRILIEKKIKTTDWEEIKSLGLTGTMTFTLTGANIALDESGNEVDEVVWTLTVDLANATVAGTDGEYTYITLGADALHGGYWVEHLPMGNYTLTETVTGALKQVSITNLDVVFDTDAQTDPAGPYDSTAANWAAQGSAGTWAIGITPVHTPVNYQDSTLRYGDESDAANSVKYDLTNGSTTPKNVDPVLSANNGKVYLNAQLGHAVVENTIKRTSIDVVKVWQPASEAPTEPIVVELRKNDTPVAYAELNAANYWSHTFDGLPIDGDTYTVVEGTGTIAADGTCNDFDPFSTDGPFDFNGKRYEQVSITYEDNAGQPLENGVVANTDPTAGTATITNQALTKVKVVKEWEGITPTQPIVVKLSSTDEPDRYVQLGPETWEYTWKDLPVADGRTYTVTEGTGNVAADGTCEDFAVFEVGADGTFTFDGKTYRLKSLTYTPAGGTEGTTPLTCVSPDSGQAKFVNEALTTIEVEKRWAEGSTKSPIVVELKGSDDSVQYVELNVGNDYKYAFENLKVVEGLTYTVTEGQGTVNPDGTCDDFQPINGTYTVGVNKMKMLSLEYFSDAEKTTEAENLSGSVSPYGGKAVFTNGPVQAKVELVKVESRDHDVTIDGVSFDLKRGDEYASATLVGSYTTANGGKIDFGYLVPGTYWLVETGAPDGYVIRDQDDPIKIVVDEEGAVTFKVKEDSTYPVPRIELNDSTGVYTLTVPNVAVYALPAAGGPGVYPFLLIGAFAAAYALSMLAEERKRLVRKAAGHEGSGRTEGGGRWTS